MLKYEELQCIGRGSYGSAYLAIERATGERYVIKKIPTELLSETEKRQSFREIDLLATLKHPNVVEYKESFVEQNTIHIVMGYCDGGDLAARIRERAASAQGFFDIRQILDWFVQMAMAIKYLHDKHVLHRDLKTSNIFLTTENVVKLGDFGIARTLESTFDQAKTVVGTPYYMSPEVCESRPYSYASDVWSLGCVLYELCALKHAFDAPNILMLVLRIVQQEFPPLPPQFDSALTDILTRLLDKHPENRPTMDQIFAIPYIRNHMQGLVASGGSLKCAVGARRLQGATPRKRGQVRLRTRRTSVEQSRRRLAATSISVTPVKARELLDQSLDDLDMQPLSDDASLADLRLPERSCTPEPLLAGIQDLKTMLDDPVSNSSTPVGAHHKPEFAWAETPEQIIDEVNEHATNPTVRDSQEMMNPNFRDEYSEECMDSLQVFYRPQLRQDPRRRRGGARSPGARSSQLPLSVPKPIAADALDDVIVEHLDGIEAPTAECSSAEATRIPCARSPELNAAAALVEEEAFDCAASDLGDPASALSESVILRQLELEQESSDEDHDDAYTSRSEYGGEDNFYSDDAASYSADSDFDQERGTEYSDDFEDADAEVIEYADDAFVPEDDISSTAASTPSSTNPASMPISIPKPTPALMIDGRPLIKSPTLRASAGIGMMATRTEVAWVMQNVAQSLLESCDQFSLLSA